METSLFRMIQNIASPDNVMADEPLSKHTTFRIGGNAECFVNAGSASEIREIIKLAKLNNIPYYILGNGSNLLVNDNGFHGIIIHIGSRMSEVRVDGDGRIYAMAGAKLGRVGNVAAENELAGFEFASGIPGSVGGAVMMNAGAYGGEIKDILVSATVMDSDGSIQTFSCEDLNMGYRTSIIEGSSYVVLDAVFKLNKGNREAIIARMKELSAKRIDKQPLEYPSAGSTFKRPEGYFAAKLIDDAGLRGFRIGDAMVSEKHAGFVINAGKATALDVIELTDYVKDKVYKEFGVMLELEVRRL